MELRTWKGRKDKDIRDVAPMELCTGFREQVSVSCKDNSLLWGEQGGNRSRRGINHQCGVESTG